MTRRHLPCLAVLCASALIPSACSSSDETTSAAPAAVAGRSGSSGAGGGSAGKAGGGGAGKGGGAGVGGAGAAGAAGNAGKAGAPAAYDMFSAWRDARDALRKSPDHLPGQAEAAVQAKDAQKIFELVRDRIATYPSQSNGLADADTAQRWGTRATLRGGAGTPREKAELLAELLTRAGFAAEVVVGKADPARLTGEAMLLRSVDRAFAPPVTPADATNWKTAFDDQTKKGAPRPVVDATGAKAAALSQSLIAQLPTTLTSPFDFTLGDVPLVRVTLNGQLTYANPLLPTAKLGESLVTGEPQPAAPAGAPQEIYVKVTVSKAEAPLDRIPLFEHTYDASQLAGRRLQLAFPPPMEPDVTAAMLPDEIESVVPLLSVVSRDLSKTEAASLAEVGPMLSLGGATFTKSAAGDVTVDGQPLATSPTDPAQLAKVASVDVGANAASFPRVKLLVSAKDATGVGVAKLGADAFSVFDDGKLVPVSVTQREAPPPRVVLLFDASTSVPAEFLGAGAVTLAEQIADAVYQKYPDAQLRVATMFFGAQYASGTWATSLADAKAQAQALATLPGSSDVWTALRDVEREHPTTIVMITDGDATDQEDAESSVALASGVPVLSIGVGAVKADTLARVSALTGGKVVSATKRDEAVAAAVEQIAARQGQDYELAYRAPSSGATLRNVKVTLNKKEGPATYDVPKVPVPARGYSGVYLTVRIGGRETTQTLAGLDVEAVIPAPAVTQAMLDDVRSLFLGRASLSIEGAAPSASVVLDDWIGDKLALEPIWKAAQAGDEAALAAALKDGLSVAPPHVSFAQSPIPGAGASDALTFETSPRVALMVQTQRPKGPVARRLSYFPLSSWATASASPRDAWERTLQKTATLAVLEADLMKGTSTLEQLMGQPVTPVAAGTAADQAGLTDQERVRWGKLEAPFAGKYQLIVPKKPGAFWAVEEATGTVIGMLPDGTGGGNEEACGALADANRMIQALSLIGSLAGASVGGWAALAQWEAKYVTIATIVISGGSPSGSTDLSNPAEDMACGMFNDWLGNQIPAYGGYDAIQGTLENTGMEGTLPGLCSSPGPCD